MSKFLKLPDNSIVNLDLVFKVIIIDRTLKFHGDGNLISIQFESNIKAEEYFKHIQGFLCY